MGSSLNQRRADTYAAADHIPLGQARVAPFGAQMRAQAVQRNGRPFYRVDGYASIFEARYEMWDAFGPYDEVVSAGAADGTLAREPDVVFLLNHRGLAMARTANGSLELSADARGLADTAWLNPKRNDVQDLVSAIDDGIVTEQSFAFQITDGSWNHDFTEFRINAFNIDRGDVSAVNYGANPHTTIAARQREIFGELDRMPAYAARAAMRRLALRVNGGGQGEGQGRRVDLIRAMLD